MLPSIPAFRCRYGAYERAYESMRFGQGCNLLKTIAIPRKTDTPMNATYILSLTTSIVFSSVFRT
jgi:hypothetical protein